MSGIASTIQFNHRYEVPTRYFYDKIVFNWESLKKETNFQLGQKEIMSIFLRKVRTGMEADWDKKIRVSKKHKKV